MYGYENSPHVAGANVANAPHQPMMPYSYAAPAYGYCAPHRGGNTFALVVVLFILLIIIGATVYGYKC
ncbi:YjcZ family sporulation protein [Metabacillus bambusae]|nr:YjcZ family sporulation protein [Metabacillus bambusae]